MSIRDRVISVLKEFPETRNDDNRLYLKVLEDMGVATVGSLGIYIKIENIDKLLSPESIRRRRQEIQNDEKRFIPTDPDVIAKRRMFYLMCPGEILSEENQPPEIIKAACGKCQKIRTEDCHKIGGVPAGLGAMG